VSEFFKSKKKLILAMSAVFLAITLMSGSFAYLFGDAAWTFDVFAALGSATEDQPPLPDDEETLEVVAPPEEPETEEIVHFNTPGDMRGVFLVPGFDFMLDGTSSSEDQVRKEIDKALDSAAELTMNTVIIQTSYEDKVIYQSSSAAEVSSGFDIMDYIVSQCRERNLYTYAIFDVSLYQRSSVAATKLAVGAGAIDKLAGNLREFSEKYQLDGILLDGYQNQREQDSYSVYLTAGGAIGYDNFMRQSPEAMVKTASQTIRAYAKGTQVGLLADAVWANAGENEEGSNTSATYTALGSANADTKDYVEEDLVDFVAVKNYGSLTDSAAPFEEIVAWWSDIVREHGIPLYVVHASNKACSEESGWEAHDQLTKQVIQAEDYSGFRGSIYNDLSRLVEDPKESTATLIKYYNEEVEAAHILTELEITKPEQTTFTTFEPEVTFTGASDPNSPVTLNDAEIETDSNGYFTLTFDLEAGVNTYVIEHKEKVLTYSITRQVQILKDMSPMGSIATEGGMTITITATAYSDAKVSASINGTTVVMEIDESLGDEEERDSFYKVFVGEYTAPGATSSEQNLGNIVVYGSWGGQSDSITGASVKVNKKAKIEDGVPVVVTAAQAQTYPPDTLNNIPDNKYFPLPQGAMDYAVGEEIVYKKGSKTYTYYVLASGLRVESGDITAVSDYASGNAISAMSVKADYDYTYVSFKMTQQVAYTLQYSSTGISVDFHYTNSVPGGLELNQNPIFSSAKWSDTTLKLTFIKEGAFMGYKGYFDDEGNLVLRFNNAPSSIGSARIVIDPGHGGSDPGALGFLANYPEKVINLAIAQLLADELESRGATVLLIDNSGNPSLDARVKQAEKWNADLFVSVHSNTTASNASAAGTEAYYFYPFSYPLALNASSNVSSQLDTNNRGAKRSYYHVTLSSQFPSVLVETGFMTNQYEYEKLISSKYQKRVAAGIADSIATSIKQMRSGSSATGEQSVGGSFSAGSSGNTADTAEGITLNNTSLTLEAGDTATLKATTTPSGLEVTWESDDRSVAKVNDNGKVTAVSEGTAKITATTEEGDTATCTVKVVEEATSSSNDDDEDDDDNGDGKQAKNASRVYFEDNDISLRVGKTRQLEVDSDIGVIRSTDFTWESTDTSVATVDKYGKVTAVGKGTAEITADSKNGEFGVYCLVTVKE